MLIFISRPHVCRWKKWPLSILVSMKNLRTKQIKMWTQVTEWNVYTYTKYITFRFIQSRMKVEWHLSLFLCWYNSYSYLHFAKLSKLVTFYSQMCWRNAISDKRRHIIFYKRRWQEKFQLYDECFEINILKSTIS